MRRFVLCIIAASAFAAPARADDWKPDRPVMPPRTYSMTDRVMSFAEAYKPRWADEQKGVVGYRPQGSKAVYGVQFNHGVGLGMSIRF
jgi:hypothetical protein